MFLSFVLFGAFVGAALGWLQQNSEARYRH